MPAIEKCLSCEPDALLAGWLNLVESLLSLARSCSALSGKWRVKRVE